MREVFVIGVGMTEFGKFRDKGLIPLGREACYEALMDSGLKQQDIQVAYCGHARTGRLLGRECGVGQSILWELGISGIPITSVGNFCASGSSAFREAWIAVGSGLYDVAMAIGVELLTAKRQKGKPLTSDGKELESAMGFTPPTFFAQLANRHMAQYGTTIEQLAMVSVKNHKNGCLNPRAQYRKAVSLEEVLISPMIVEPLTLLSCCPISDGGAAAILVSKEWARKAPQKPVQVMASILTSGSYKKQKDITTIEATVRAAKEAYEMAGIGPEDVDLAEVHDCFTPAELVHYEDLGFCPKGEGGLFIQHGHSEIGGKVSVNPSGGLLTKGHPLGATGIAQICEVVWHLREQAGQRQVPGARVGLTHCAGGFQESLELAEVSACTVNILKI